MRMTAFMFNACAPWSLWNNSSNNNWGRKRFLREKGGRKEGDGGWVGEKVGRWEEGGGRERKGEEGEKKERRKGTK